MLSQRCFSVTSRIIGNSLFTSIAAISPIAVVPSEEKGGSSGDGGGGDGKGVAVVNGGEPTPISLRHVSIEAKKVLRDLQLPAKKEGGWGQNI